MNTITINDIQYIERPIRKNKSNMAFLASMMIAVTEMSFAKTGSLKGKPPEVNIISEFELIQEKKSKLSKSEREYVIRMFNQKFMPL